jgi:hypothetical protein
MEQYKVSQARLVTRRIEKEMLKFHIQQAQTNLQFALKHAIDGGLDDNVTDELRAMISNADDLTRYVGVKS